MPTPFDNIGAASFPEPPPGIAPNFGPPAGAAPIAPPVAPPMAPPTAPPGPAFSPMQPRPHQSPNFMQAALPMFAAAFASHGDPAAIGAGLAAFLHGAEMRRQQTESQEDRLHRKQVEQAKFYGDLVQSAQTYDDEAALRKDLEAVRPVAQLYGVNVDMIHVSDTKKQAKARKDAAGVMDQLRRVHKDAVDDPAWQAVHSSTVNGVTMKVSEIAKLAEAPTVTDASGQATAPPSLFKSDNPNELKINAYARDHGKRPEQLTATEIQEALGEGKPATATVGSFEDYVVRRFGKNPTPDQITLARKDYQQADDRPPSTGAGDYRDFLMSEKLAKDWQTASTPVREMRRQFGLMQTGLSRFRGGDKNGGSQAVLVTFQKILDPTSVVRESEYARTATGQAFLERMQGYVEKLAKGGAGMTDTELASMVETAKQMLGNAETFTQGTRHRLEQSATRYKVPHELVFDDNGSVSQPAASAPPAPAGWKYVPKPGGGWTAVEAK